MGRKLFYIFTVLLFSLSTASAVNETKLPFPIKGGTTSDGIKVTEPLIDGFLIMENTKELNVIERKTKATMTFNVTVPDGKVAVLEYKVFIMLMKEAGVKVKSPKLYFTARMDDKVVGKHENNKSMIIDANSEVIRITSGKEHTITLEANFTASSNAQYCTMQGGIKTMYIHVHHFGESRLVRQPICGQPGETNSKCKVCGIDSTVYIAPQYKEHSLKKSSTTKNSCLSNVGSVTICEHCPYTEIEHNDEITSHTFDNDGVCTVCGLRKPKSNAANSVYEVNNASEMRVLAEMVSIGTIPGNIGIDIKADLVFNNETSMLPLGTIEHPFQGVLNGNGHRIRGITNCFQGIDCLGFVGVAKGTPLSHAVIANLIFDAENTMRGTACVGGIVGYAEYCDIVNCASFGVLEGSNYVGSIVGYADQQVSFHNCASVSSIRTQGHWNPMACGLPYGHILNSYGAATNSLDGQPDEMLTTTFRHCFTTMGSDEGLTQVSPDVMSSYSMLELLNEESESPSFMMSETDAYPIPVVNSTIQAAPNRSIPTTWKAIPRRAPMADLTDADDEDDEKNYEKEVFGGYVDEGTIATFGTSIEDVVSKDSVEYADFDRTYISTRSISDEELELFKPMDGGELLTFESYMLSPDSTFLKKTEFLLVSPEKVKAVSESINDWSGSDDFIDEYAIADGTRTLVSRTIIEGEENIFYQENIDGILRTKWSIQTAYDESGDATAIEVYSHNYKTGETQLQYRTKFGQSKEGTDQEVETYVEYTDEATNTIHILFNYLDSITGAVISREHFILDASTEYPMQFLTEKMIDNEPYLTAGMYFVYDDDETDGRKTLLQSVVYGPEDANKPGIDLRPYLYFEYLGLWEPEPYPTAIKIPTVEKPSLQKQTDYNVYDMHGRVVRRVTDVHNPFSGLPNGLYIYQGAKYLKRN